MKHLAVTLALFWWAQGAVCLLPGLSHTHSADLATTGAGHSHHEMHANPGAPVPHETNAPLQEGDLSCAQHCASLSQALSPVASAAAWIATLWLPLPPPEVQPSILRVATRSLDSHHGPPPPNLIIANASLLI